MMTMQLILIAFRAIVTDQLLKSVSFDGNSSTAVDDCDSQGEAILLALHFISRLKRNALTLNMFQSHQIQTELGSTC